MSPGSKLLCVSHRFSESFLFFVGFMGQPAWPERSQPQNSVTSQNTSNTTNFTPIQCAFEIRKVPSKIWGVLNFLKLQLMLEILLLKGLSDDKESIISIHK